MLAGTSKKKMLAGGNDRSRSLWLSCLSSAFRTAIACSIVAAATLFGPSSLHRQLAFPAFSYVTVILVVTGASLGDTFRGCRDAIFATILTVFPAILALWAINPSHLTTPLTSVMVAIAAFLVMLPDHRTHLVSKRIALGQIVIIYVIAYDQGGETDAVMHPVHVAASTAVGVLACVLALLLPFPNLASCQVKKKCKIFAENASERVKLYVEAFCAEDNGSAQAFVLQAKSLGNIGTKLLNKIKSKQESMRWERLVIKFLKPYCMISPTEKLQDIEMALKGMEIALSHFHTFPTQILDQDIKDGLHKLEENISLTLDQVKSCMPFDLATFPESDQEHELFSCHSFPQTEKDLPPFFFLFCFKLLQTKIIATSPKTPPKKIPSDISPQKSWSFSEWIQSSSFQFNRRFMLALKCSLSVGFAVLFGLIYSKQNGIWSGLPVAISFATSREATFRVANLKAQGTVLGTVYGVLGCFVLERFVKVRFLILIPWFIFCSLLRRSRMYGPAGGISAVIGAVLILGRENFGPPREFAINRIVETFIGLSCSIIVEIMFQPARASTLAKAQLSKTLKSLHECVSAVSFGDSKDSIGHSQKKLKANVNKLRKFIEEAEMEPDFWFLPFHSACYNKFLKTLSDMADLLFFLSHAIRLLNQESMQMDDNVPKLILNKLEGELELFKETVNPSIKCFEKVTLVKSLEKLEKELQNSEAANRNTSDIETGKSPVVPKMLNGHGSSAEDIVSSHLQRLKEVFLGGDEEGSDTEEEAKKGRELVLGLSAIAFCMSGLVRGTMEMENEVKELVQWENPLSHVNLFDISCKIHALYSL